MTFSVSTTLGIVDRLGAIIGKQNEQIIDLNLAFRSYLESRGEGNAPATANAKIPPNSMIGLIEGGKSSIVACQTAIDFVSQNHAQQVDEENKQEEAEGSTALRQQKQGKLIYRADETAFLAPIPFPRVIMDFQTFEQHVLNFAKKLGGQVPKEWYDIPACYKKNPGSVIGHNSKVVKPHYSQELDYELELAIYVGRKAKNIDESSSYDNIFGYSIFNDFSARDIQLREMKINLGPFKGKDFDTSAAFGPWIVTSDEIPDPQNLKMKSRLNGNLMSEGSTKDMHWSIKKLMAYSSMEETLYPGYILGSGTAGFGSGYENDIRLREGDVIELEIEGIGKLTNQVSSEGGGRMSTSDLHKLVL